MFPANGPRQWVSSPMFNGEQPGSVVSLSLQENIVIIDIVNKIAIDKNFETYFQKSLRTSIGDDSSNQYVINDAKKIYHFDFYRLENESEALDIQAKKHYLDNGIEKIIFLSQLRDAPALGAGVDAALNFYQS